MRLPKDAAGLRFLLVVLVLLALTYLFLQEQVSVTVREPLVKGAVGLSFDGRGGRVAVASVIDGMPAKEAGIMGGDIVDAVDGVSVRNSNVDEVKALMEGTPGTNVTLKVERGGEEMTFVITRAYFSPFER
jgi:carboxyl-terminal processing protease